MLLEHLDALSPDLVDRGPRQAPLPDAAARTSSTAAPRAAATSTHHYDLDGRLYSLFLDTDLQYSCAYFEDGVPTSTRRSSPRSGTSRPSSRIEPGMKVLDIGSGWGGLGLYLAEHCGRRGHRRDAVGGAVRGRQPARRGAGLGDRVRFLLQDYRTVEGPFDRIVSVGMFEHVGVDHYRRVLRGRARDLLTRRRRHACSTRSAASTGRATPIPGSRNTSSPAATSRRCRRSCRRSRRRGLRITDIEILRLHYAKTLRAWRERFLAHREEVAALYDERFCRMWEFYLAGCGDGVPLPGHDEFPDPADQAQDALPLTRDYMWEAEKRLRTTMVRTEKRPPLKLAGE